MKKNFRPTPNTSHRPRAGRNVVEKAWYLNKQWNPWSQRYSSADTRLEEGAHRRSKVRRSRAGPKGSTPHENKKGNALCQKPDVGTDRGGYVAIPALRRRTARPAKCAPGSRVGHATHANATSNLTQCLCSLGVPKPPLVSTTIDKKRTCWDSPRRQLRCPNVGLCGLHRLQQPWFPPCPKTVQLLRYRDGKIECNLTTKERRKYVSAGLRWEGPVCGGSCCQHLTALEKQEPSPFFSGRRQVLRAHYTGRHTPHQPDTSQNDAHWCPGRGRILYTRHLDWFLTHHAAHAPRGRKRQAPFWCGRREQEWENLWYQDLLLKEKLPFLNGRCATQLQDPPRLIHQVAELLLGLRQGHSGPQKLVWSFFTAIIFFGRN